MLDGALTARVLTGLMAIPRAAGDGPDYAAWQAPLPGAPAAPVPDFTLYRALVQAETKKSVRAGPKMHRKIHVLPAKNARAKPPALPRMLT